MESYHLFSLKYWVDAYAIFSVSVLWFCYQETFSSAERPVLDVHQRRSYYVVPQNKLGQDIYIRTTENRSSLVTLLPSGDDRSIKVPALKDLLDSHLNGVSVKSYRLMITAILADAEVTLSFCTQSYTLLSVCAFSETKWAQLFDLLTACILFHLC